MKNNLNKTYKLEVEDKNICKELFNENLLNNCQNKNYKNDACVIKNDNLNDGKLNENNNIDIGQFNQCLKSNERLDDLQFKDLYIIQKVDGYCFTSDAVKLANFARVKNGGILIDLCSGSGVVGILAQAKNNVKKTYLIELQSRLADMSLRSVKLNKLQDKVEVVCGDLVNIHNQIGCGFADTIVCNPPYKKASSSLLSENEEIAIAKHEIKVTLEDIVKEASKLLKFGGRFYLINKEERLIEIICELKKYSLEPKVIKICKASGQSLVMIGSVLGGKSGVKIEID